VRQWWTQADVLEALSAVHAADEQLATARSTSDLLARASILRADLTRLLGEDDPRRRDVLRLLDRLTDESNELLMVAVEGMREQDDDERSTGTGLRERLQKRGERPTRRRTRPEPDEDQQPVVADDDDEPGNDDLPWKA
jgi:hypothetical protein